MINEPVAEGEGGMQALMQQLAAGMGGARPAYAYLPSFLPAGMPAVLPSAPPILLTTWLLPARPTRPPFDRVCTAPKSAEGGLPPSPTFVPRSAEGDPPTHPASLPPGSLQRVTSRPGPPGPLHACRG